MLNFSRYYNKRNMELYEISNSVNTERDGVGRDAQFQGLE